MFRSTLWELGTSTGQQVCSLLLVSHKSIDDSIELLHKAEQCLPTLGTLFAVITRKINCSCVMESRLVLDSNLDSTILGPPLSAANKVTTTLVFWIVCTNTIIKVKR